MRRKDTEREKRQTGAKTHCRNVIEPFKLVCSEDDSAVFISSGLLVAFSSEHEMKLDDPITTESCHSKYKKM